MHNFFSSIVLISYCVDSENRNRNKIQSQNKAQVPNDTMQGSYGAAASNYQYTIADVPRLAEYSASVYASNPVEQDHYLKYYTQYYYAEIPKVSIKAISV